MNEKLNTEARAIPIPDFDPDEALEVLYKIFRRATFLGLAPFAYHSGPRWSGWRFDDGTSPRGRCDIMRTTLMKNIKEWIVKHGMDGVIRIGSDNWIVWPNVPELPSGNKIRSDAKKYTGNDPLMTAKVRVPYKGLQIEDGEVVDYVGTESHVVIPDGVTCITHHVFANNKALKTIDLPESLLKIGHAAFSGATSLEAIKIPNSVNYIGTSAFEDCSSLQSANIPNSLSNYLFEDVFEGCSSLKDLVVGDGLPRGHLNIGPIESAVFNESKTILYYAPKNFSGTFDIPETVKELGNTSFHHLHGLTGVTIPNGLTRIGNMAFADCPGLTEINLPPSVNDLGWRAFDGCSNLTSIKIPNKVKEIDNGTFEDCVSLTSVVLPPGLTEIGNGAFENCTNLESIDLPNGLQMLSYSAFKNSGLTQITVPASVKDFRTEVFEDCENLVSIVLPDGMEKITWNMFSGCVNLKSIVIPDSVKAIEYGAFEECVSLTSIVIPEGVTGIGERAFENCKGLVKVKLPSGLFEEIIKNPDKSFKGTPWAEKVKNGGLSFNVDDKGTLDKYEGHDTIITIPDEVHVIGAGAFFGNDSIKKVTIPDTVTVIEPGAFENCEGLETIVLGVGIKKIEKDTFKNVSDNITIYVPDFDMCKLLLDSGLPDSATVIIGKGSSRRKLSWDPEK